MNSILSFFEIVFLFIGFTSIAFAMFIGICAWVSPKTALLVVDFINKIIVGLSDKIQKRAEAKGPTQLEEAEQVIS